MGIRWRSLFRTFDQCGSRRDSIFSLFTVSQGLFLDLQDLADFSSLVLHVEAAVSQSIMQKTLKIRITDFKETKEGEGNEEGDNQDAVQPAIGKITQLINSDVSRLINAR